MDLTEYEPHRIPGSVEIIEGTGGLPLLRATNCFAECDVFLYGAHMARFKPAGGEEDLLWMSPTSFFEAGKPIRGGIPVCFPWFGAHESRADLPLHGVVRTRLWDIESTAVLSDGRVRIVLAIADDETTRTAWPHAFRLELAVTVGKVLDVSMTVENTGPDPFRYAESFHTYFRVGHAHGCDVEGLDGVGYVDRVRKDSRAVQYGPLRLSGETVNAYLRAPARCSLADPIMKRRLVVEQRGFSDTVVWNPGKEAAARNPEIGAAWNQYLCVESANCLDDQVCLMPGTSHRSSARFWTERL